MRKDSILNHSYRKSKAFFDESISKFEIKGEGFGNQDRNSIKLFKIRDMIFNVKSFKVPNFINQIVYRFFRKSKAQRSYEYANKLKKLDIGTPDPVAYYEFKTAFLFKKSFYISEHLNYDFTYRELTKDLNYPDHENILRAFTRFTYNLHEKGVNFLDHSPGNTLIKKKDSLYHFYLVDLNRMEFRSMPFKDRIKNFSRLTTHKSIVETMSDEYAKLIGTDYNKVFDLMWSCTQNFQEKFNNKKRLKKKLKFWKTKR